jgi:hypothetical protein
MSTRVKANYDIISLDSDMVRLVLATQTVLHAYGNF